MYQLAVLALVLACVPAGLWTVNMISFRPLRSSDDAPDPGDVAPFSVLIPARNEADRIGPALDALLDCDHKEMEVVVYDDRSEDDTAEVVRERSRADDRVRLVEGTEMPDGWCGKQHACWRLSREARFDRFCFLDADVRIRGSNLIRVLGAFRDRDVRLLSGFPRQETRTIGEKLLVSFIHYILLGFLPIWFMRRTTFVGFAAGCGQLMITDRDTYEAVDGHRAIRRSRHDGVTLPAAYRRHGFRTDIVDVHRIARVRMYGSFRETWDGLAKNATEGIARPIALPIFTLLLGGGQVLPVLLLPLLVITGAPFGAAPVTAAAVVLGYLPRVWGVFRFDQSPVGALLHPAGVVLLLINQWSAFIRSLRGGSVEWRGRSYGDGDDG